MNINDLNPSESQPRNPITSAAGKNLTFALDGQSFGISVLQIREIIREAPISTVPQVPAHVLGVVNLRGRVVPVMDLKRRLDMPETPRSERACIIVVETGPTGATRRMGLLVDGLEEVAHFAQHDMEAVTEFGGFASECVWGMAKSHGRLKPVLDVDREIGSQAGSNQ